jgi:hypothetical protein
MEQQFRVYGPVAWGAGTVAATLGTTPDWTSANFAGTGGVLSVLAFTAMRIRGLAIVPTIVATTAPIFTTKVNRSYGVTTNARTVNDTATVLLSITAGDCYYHWFDDDDIRVNPGEQVVVLASTAGGATSTGWVGLIVSEFLIGPSSGGTVTVPVVRSKPFGGGVAVGQIKITSSSSSGN